MSLLGILGFSGAAAGAADEADAILEIASALGRFPPERARFLAAFAYLLGRVARADHEVSAEETTEMRRLVGERGLDEQESQLVVEMAAAQGELFGGTEDFVVTRELERAASHEQKLQLVDCLFAVGAADLNISTLEDNEVRRIASELRLSHADFIAVRRRWREHLGVLKPPAPAAD